MEAKLTAGTGRNQVSDLLKAKCKAFGLAPRTPVDVALIGNKAIVPHGVAHSSRWLGAITWAELLDEFAAIEFTDDERTGRWRALLTDYRRRDAFGTGLGTSATTDQLLNAAVFAAIREINESIGPKRTVRPVSWSSTSENVVRKTQRGARTRLSVTRPTPMKKARELRFRLVDVAGPGGATIRVAVEASKFGIGAETSSGRSVDALRDAIVRVARDVIDTW
ncbi:MAG: hypothetical protein ACLP01_24255 [Solirubrobacteraceae bacterium]